MADEDVTPIPMGSVYRVTGYVVSNVKELTVSLNGSLLLCYPNLETVNQNGSFVLSELENFRSTIIPKLNFQTQSIKRLCCIIVR